MHNPATILVLRAIHVLVGVFWVGAVLFITAFLTPSLRSAGSAVGPIMQQLVQVRRMPVWLMGASLVTIGSGFWLYWIDSSGMHASWLGSGAGRTFGLGGVLAVAAAAVGMGINAPTARRVGTLSAQIQQAERAPSANEAAELTRLQGRLGRGSIVAGVFLVLATLAMAVARYTP